MDAEITKILVSKEEIAEMCSRLGKEITEDYRGKQVILICVLKGAFVFLADLIREIDLPCEVDFMSVSSYSGKHSTGVVKIIKDLDTNITGKHVLIVEDIVDSGLTLKHLRDLLDTRNPASIRICTAFDKPDRRKVEIFVDYIGMEIPDEFIVGYGLDLDQRYRNLPEVAVLNPELTNAEAGPEVEKDEVSELGGQE
ncbi:MAG TPA: hypoxanthine phosphoribosyltransferase [Clostridiaceae bacterium]|nr:hypoxanthine phosphoribosyltransferase [Clostridiaceae bacterium]